MLATVAGAGKLSVSGKKNTFWLLTHVKRLSQSSIRSNDSDVLIVTYRRLTLRGKESLNLTVSFIRSRGLSCSLGVSQALSQWSGSLLHQAGVSQRRSGWAEFAVLLKENTIHTSTKKKTTGWRQGMYVKKKLAIALANSCLQKAAISLKASQSQAWKSTIDWLV